MSKTIVKIDPNAFENEIKKQGLKIWWLAEQLKVDRKTVSRWLSGKVKWVREENLIAAAVILCCSPETLMARSEITLFATREDHTSAAHSIYSEKLLSVLTPSGKFELAEIVIKSLLSPDLPLITLANLYIELANCCWKQNKLSEAENYALCVLEISERADDPLLALRAQQHLVTIYSKGGQLTKAHELIELCLSNPAIDVDPEIHARILFDSSNNLGHAGASIDFICEARQSARDILEKSGNFTFMHEALYELGMAIFLMDWGRFDEAGQACRRAHESASRLDFKQGICFAKVIEADLCSRLGNHHDALKLFREYYPGIQFGDTGLYEALGAGIFRRDGKYEEALTLAQVGLGSHNKVFQAHCSLEMAYAHSEMGNIKDARHCFLQAKASYEQAGAFGRVRRLREGLLFTRVGFKKKVSVLKCVSPSSRSIRAATFGYMIDPPLQNRA